LTSFRIKLIWKMKFRTEIKAEPSARKISHGEALFLMGSCFAEHIGLKLKEAGFDVLSNPFGISYNPASIGEIIKRLMDKRGISADELFENRGFWHAYDFHGSYSAAEKDRALQSMQKQFELGSSYLRKARHLLITFGTSQVFRLRDSGKVVNNCHKMPAAVFERSMLSLEEMQSQWLALLDQYFGMNRSVHVVLTVSPVRYLGDGAAANTRSKARLIELAHRLTERYEQLSYFPAYEIFMDDLRDYRFYDKSLVHPSEMGIEYVWEKFSACFFTKETREIANKLGALSKSLRHRPLHPESKAHRAFQKKLYDEIEEIKKRHPAIRFPAEPWH